MNGLTETQSFYDDLASNYHLVYQDWPRSVRHQGDVLATLIRARSEVNQPQRVLDCSCGIGTQAIGLALQGYMVTGTDLSPASIARAGHEAATFEVAVPFTVADMRNLTSAVSGAFEVVISCDNSLPHLLEDADIRVALEGMYERLRPGGLLVIGIRDYDALVQERPRFTEPQVVEEKGGRSVLFQLWDWAADGASYRLTLFIMKQTRDGWETAIHGTTYRALLRHELTAFAHSSGFTSVQWHFPQETGHHQPLMTAIRGEREDST